MNSTAFLCLVPLYFDPVAQQKSLEVIHTDKRCMRGDRGGKRRRRDVKCAGGQGVKVRVALLFSPSAG